MKAKGISRFLLSWITVVGVTSLVISRASAQFAGSKDVSKSGYSLPQVDEVHLQSYEDFKKFMAAKQWSRAFRSIASQLDDPPQGCLPVLAGTAFSWRLRLWRDFAEMSGDGRRAFRLFYDARAGKAFAQALAQADVKQRRLALERLYFSFFVTRHGDDVAFALAQEAMRANQPNEARGYLEAIFEYHLDSDLDLPVVFALHLKALSATSGKDELTEAAEYAEDRCGDDEFEIDGELLTLGAYATKLAESRLGNGEPARDYCDFEFGDEPNRQWTVKLDPMRTNNSQGWIPVLSVDLPDVCLHRERLFANHGGVLKCFDAATGESIWSKGRSISNQQGVLNGRCFVVPAGDHVLYSSPPGLTFARKGKKQIRMKCLDAATGDTIWSTRTIDGIRHHSLVSRPVVCGGRIFVAACPQGVSKLELLILDLATGELEISIELGSPGQIGSQRVFWMGQNAPSLARMSPTLYVIDSKIYILTDGGAVLALNWVTRRLLWAHFYPLSARNDATTSPASGIIEDNVLYFRARGLKRLVALDLSSGDRLWERSCRYNESLVAIDEHRFYLMGHGLRALDRGTRDPLWSNPAIRRGSGPGRVVQTDGSLVLVHRKSVCLVDKQSGDISSSWRNVFKAGSKPAETKDSKKPADAEVGGDKNAKNAAKLKKIKRKLRLKRRRRGVVKQTMGGSVFVAGNRIIAACASGIVCLTEEVKSDSEKLGK
ncbi:MAG: PQQ-binding-like beta-propeller repeat protein [Planctomycetota bacterium]